jgi:hypothetical protein
VIALWLAVLKAPILPAFESAIPVPAIHMGIHREAGRGANSRREELIHG